MMRHFNHAVDEVGIGQVKPKPQCFADVECAIDSQPNAFFREIDHAAGEGFIPASHFSRSID